MTYRFLTSFVSLLISAVWTLNVAHAELTIDITQGVVEPMPLAVADLYGKGQMEKSFGAKIAEVVANDLERSGLFTPIDKEAFIQDGESLNVLPRFGDWRIINAQALVQGRVEMTVDGRMRVEFRLWDVLIEKQMVGRAYFSVPSNWRRVAHKISDEIYKRITGESGYFDSRIVYIAESGPKINRVKRLAIMDQDGEKHSFLTDGADLVLTPRFSPNQQEITYLSYYKGVPRVYIFNIESGRQEILGEFPGMTYAPRFSADGRSVIFAMTKNGNSELYTMHLATRKTRKLTNHSAIDTSPSYAPDGKKIVFNSDRSGTQQLYVMNSSGGGVKRISFNKGRYATPVWSPRGDWIAFTRMYQKKFFIGVMRPDGTGERLLTKGFLVESPTWAPNGRVLMFFRQDKSDAYGRGGRTRVFSIDFTGHNEREVITPLDASDPAWSPLLP
ncbi:MAG: Tol-Pal system beta propeller repeat protein TolB [Rhodospirillaceae bacterium]|nr:MAG: Tol-Pal system beta propeller repeat protein TolB [Rhodospirillaceae bacterium]